MSKMQQLSLWGEPPELDQARLPPAQQASHIRDQEPTVNETRDLQSLPDDVAGADSCEPQRQDAPPAPMFTPLQSAIDAGVFGVTAEGPMEPDEHEIAALTQEHSYELIITLVEISVLEDALRSGIDPRTGRMPRTPESAERSAERWRSELQSLQSKYADMLAAFEQGFGPAATCELDTWVRGQVAGTPARPPYDPGHPWHYYWAGDAAEPLPFEQIPPAEDVGRWLERDLPKNPAKRLAKVREMLGREEQQLVADRERYEDIVARGAEALSRFDREIAYGGNDELARAGTIALKYNHIRMGLGLLRWLGEQLGHGHRGEPIPAAVNRRNN
ncbi:MAG: hypothetical protein U1D55_07465 [Phycisphaerae bacterium]